MDPLFQQAKQMYPNASDQEIEQSLAKIRQEQPEASDDEIVQAASKIQSSQQDGSYSKMAVRETLKQKYGLGQYSPEARQKLVDENNAAASPIASAFAGFGAGIRGGNVSAAFDSAMAGSQAKTKAKLDAFDKDRENLSKDFAFERDLTKADREDTLRAEMQDPNSERSKAAQQSLIDDYGMDPAVAAKMTAEQAEARLPGLKQKLDREMREREFSERQKDRNLQREMMMSTKEQARQDKLDKEAKLSEKQVGQITEFDDALSSIESIKRQKDEFDTGPVSAIQSGIAGAIGIDDSKKSAFKAQVQDDLARYIKSISGGAVSDEERAFLIQNLPTMKDNDETFKTKLDVVEARLKRNRENFLKNTEKAGKNVKEFKREETPTEETKTINGKKYRKVQGGWEEI